MDPATYTTHREAPGKAEAAERRREAARQRRGVLLRRLLVAVLVLAAGVGAGLLCHLGPAHRLACGVPVGLAALVSLWWLARR